VNKLFLKTLLKAF